MCRYRTVSRACARRWRICGWGLRDYFFEALNPEVAAAVESAIQALRPQFREVREVVKMARPLAFRAREANCCCETPALV
jgi:hypothetical protein